MCTIPYHVYCINHASLIEALATAFVLQMSMGMLIRRCSGIRMSSTCFTVSDSRVHA